MTSTEILTGFLRVAERVAPSIALRSVILLGMTLVLAGLLSKRSAAHRSLVWRLSLIGVVLLPTLQLWPTLEVPVVSPVEWSVLSTRTEPGLLVSERGPNVTASVESPKRAQGAFSFSVGAVLILLWVFGSPLLLARLAFLHLRARWLVFRAEAVTDATLVGEVDGMIERGDIPRRIRLLQSSEIEVPATWGVLRPALIVPRGAAQWDPSRRFRILRHEIAHLRRRDPLYALAGEVAEALYWWNPLVWYASRRARDESERACDDSVLASGSRPSDYANDLVSLTRRIRMRGASAISGGRLQQRIRVLFEDRRRDEPSRGVTGAMIAIALAVLTVTGTTDFAATATPLAATPEATIASEPLPRWNPEQLRWSGPGRAGGMFVEGAMDLAPLLRNQPFLGTDGLLVSFEHRADGKIATFAAWEERGEIRTFEDGASQDSLRALIGWLAPDWRDQPDTFIGHVAHNPALAGRTPAGTSGSVILGIPGSSRNPDTGTLQAGWFEGESRVGVFARGPLELDVTGTSLRSLDPGAWLAAMIWNARDRRLETMVILPGPGGAPAVRFLENGVERTPDPSLIGRILSRLSPSTGSEPNELIWTR